MVDEYQEMKDLLEANPKIGYSGLVTTALDVNRPSPSRGPAK